jgi:hypothetical protein
MRLWRPRINGHAIRAEVRIGINDDGRYFAVHYFGKDGKGERTTSVDAECIEHVWDALADGLGMDKLPKPDWGQVAHNKPLDPELKLGWGQVVDDAPSDGVWFQKPPESYPDLKATGWEAGQGDAVMAAAVKEANMCSLERAIAACPAKHGIVYGDGVQRDGDCGWLLWTGDCFVSSFGDIRSGFLYAIPTVEAKP